MKKQRITALLAITACTWAQAATFVVDTTTDLSDPTPGDGTWRCAGGVMGSSKDSCWHFYRKSVCSSRASSASSY